MENGTNPQTYDIISIKKSKRKRKEMAQFEVGGIGLLDIKVKDLRELLANYDDDAVMTVYGGSDNGWEFVEVKINEEVIADT